MKKLYLVIIALAIPAIALAADSYSYDTNINTPQKITLEESGAQVVPNTEESSMMSDTVCLETSSGYVLAKKTRTTPNSGQTTIEYTDINTGEQIPGNYREVEEEKCQNQTSTGTDTETENSFGTAEVTVVTIIDQKEISVYGSSVTVKLGDSNVGGCLTNTDGVCDLKISKTPNSDLTSSIIIEAEKGKSGSIQTSIGRFLENGAKIIIENLSLQEAEETIDYNNDETEPTLEAPVIGTAGIELGNNSINVQVTRPSRVGTINNSLTAVGGVEFVLNAYFSNASLGGNSGDINYQTGTESFSYSARNTFKSIFGSSKRYKMEGTIPDNGTSSSLVITGLPEGAYHMKFSKDKYLDTDIQFVIKGENQTIDVRPINIRPRRGAEPPSVNSQVTRSIGTDKEVYWTNINGQNYSYLPEYPWAGWQKINELQMEEPTYSQQDGYSLGQADSGMNDYWSFLSGVLPYTGSNIDSEDAAIAAGVMGLTNFFDSSSGPKTLDKFMDTTLVPGLVTYLSSKAMGGNESSIDFRRYNDNQSPWNSGYGNSGDCWGCYTMSDPYPTNCPPQCLDIRNLPIFGQLTRIPINF